MNVGPIGSAPHTRTHESETQTPSQKSTQTGRQNRKPSSRKNSLERSQNGPIKPTDKNQETPDSTKRASEETPKEGSRRGNSVIFYLLVCRSGHLSVVLAVSIKCHSHNLLQTDTPCICGDSHSLVYCMCLDSQTNSFLCLTLDKFYSV